jgi:hypothetical protein
MTWTANQILRVIAAQGIGDGCVSLHKIKPGVPDLTSRQVADACATLVRNGLLAQCKYADGRVRPGQYKLTAPGRRALETAQQVVSGPKAPHGTARPTPGSQRERCWRAMRIKLKFSVADIMRLVACDCDAVAQQRAEDNIGKYVRALARVGYLQVLPKREAGSAVSSPGWLRYLLVVDTGPKAPHVRRAGVVFDPNIDAEVPFVH